MFSDCFAGDGAQHLLYGGGGLTTSQSLQSFDEPRIDDALDEFDGDFRDGIDHAGQRVEPHQGFHLLTGFTRGVSLHTVIEQDLASSAGDQFEEFHFRFVLGFGLAGKKAGLVAGKVIRRLRSLATCLCGFQAWQEERVAHFHAPPLLPSSVEPRLLRIHPHPAPWQLVQRLRAGGVDHESGRTGVAHRRGRQRLLAVLLQPHQGIDIPAPSAVVEQHALGHAAQADGGFRGDGERVTQSRIDSTHAGPAEVDDHLALQLLEQSDEFTGAQVLLPFYAATFPPCHARTMRVGFMAGIQHLGLRAHGFRTYQDHTHIRFGSWVRCSWVWLDYPQTAYSTGKGLEVRVGVAAIELLAEALRALAVVAELRVQLAEEAKGDGARTAGPSEVVPQESQAVRSRSSALGLDLVLAEPAKALDLMSTAAQAKHTGEVVEDFLDVHSAGKDAELHHSDEPPVAVTLERFSKVHHAAPALLGALGFHAFLLAGDYFEHVLSGLLIERVAVVVEVAIRPGLAVEAAGVPACNVGKLADELAHPLGVGSADDRLNAHGDVAAAGAVHRGTDGIEPFNEPDQMLHTALAMEDGGDEFAGDLPSVAADGAIAFIRIPQDLS